MRSTGSPGTALRYASPRRPPIEWHTTREPDVVTRPNTVRQDRHFADALEAVVSRVENAEVGHRVLLVRVRCGDDDVFVPRTRGWRRDAGRRSDRRVRGRPRPQLRVSRSTGPTADRPRPPKNG